MSSYWLYVIGILSIVTDRTFHIFDNHIVLNINYYFKIYRIIFFIRIISIFRYTSPKHVFRTFSMTNIPVNTENISDKETQSKIGKVFSDLSTSRIVLSAILLICVVYTIYGVPSYNYSIYDYYVNYINKLQLDFNVEESEFGDILNIMSKKVNGLIYADICDVKCATRVIPSTMLSKESFTNLLINIPNPSWNINSNTTLDDIEKKYRSFEYYIVSVNTCYYDNHTEYQRSLDPPCETKMVFDMSNYYSSLV